MLQGIEKPGRFLRLPGLIGMSFSRVILAGCSPAEPASASPAAIILQSQPFPWLAKTSQWRPVQIAVVSLRGALQGGVRAGTASFAITPDDSGGYQSGLGPDCDRTKFSPPGKKTSVLIGLPEEP